MPNILERFFVKILHGAVFSIAALPLLLSAAAQEQITVSTSDLRDGTCAGAFVRHSLDHVTTTAQPVRMFESNGSGTGLGDLDSDGDLDIVLANLTLEATLLWNDGPLRFTSQRLNIGAPTRTVSIVDVDGDGSLDIVFTTQLGAPLYLRSTGTAVAGKRPEFLREPLMGVSRPAYSMDWADVDADGDLDFAAASYDAELELELKDTFMFGDRAGVFYYQQVEGTFLPVRLANASQGLVTYFFDADSDGRLDLLIGNDFAVPDYAWRWQGQWVETNPVAVMTHSTMSFDSADLDNDGALELLAVDMMPYAEDAVTLAAWQPLMEMMMAHPMVEGDPQVMENVLLDAPTADAENIAASLGVSATGWSWSAKFADFDADGMVDLYVVNGMIAEDLFGHLPGGELVEENQAFRNQSGLRFVAAPEWRLNATESGRGMSIGDLDGDGDPDIVVNNLLSASVLFENQLCGGNDLLIDLRWPTSRNPFAIGATVELDTTIGTLTRRVRVGSGYASSDPATLHFGFPVDATVRSIRILWPDGTEYVTDAIPDRPARMLFTRE